jgi:hypothetical protein
MKKGRTGECVGGGIRGIKNSEKNQRPGLHNSKKALGLRYHERSKEGKKKGSNEINKRKSNEPSTP